MENNEFKNIVAFCILMQNGEGIMSKAPQYIKEKFDVCMNDGRPLDSKNQHIYQKYLETWKIKE